MIKNKDLYSEINVPKNEYINEYYMIKNESIIRGKNKN
jgi:hypothetical protein